MTDSVAKNPTNPHFLILTEPHRMFFALGTILSILVVSWWVYYQYLLKIGLAHPLPISAPSIHMYTLVYGMSTSFILGFILTVFPRWLNYPAIPNKWITTFFFCYLCGNLIYLLGLFVNRISWITVGSFFNFLGFLLVWGTLLKGLYQAKHPDKMQPTVALLGFTGGVFGSGSYLIFSITEEHIFYQISYGIGIYFFLYLIIYAVIYRMIPFFTQCVFSDYKIIRYPYVLLACPFLVGIKTIFFVLGLPKFYWIPDGGLLIITLWQFHAWRFFMKKPVMLLKMLYLSVAWLPISNIIFIAYSIYIYIYGQINLQFEEAALHGLTIGCFGSLVFAMATRVSLGHSGRKLHSGRLVDALFWSLQAACVTRILSGLYSVIDPAFFVHNYHAGYFWLMSFGIWAVKFLPIYFCPRVDQ